MSIHSPFFFVFLIVQNGIVIQFAASLVLTLCHNTPPLKYPIPVAHLPNVDTPGISLNDLESRSSELVDHDFANADTKECYISQVNQCNSAK